KVQMAHHNLALDDPCTMVKRPAAVFCRNVLMYFGREESEACIQRIAHSIAPSSHLFLGHSDSPGRMTRFFAPVKVARVLCYRRLVDEPAAPVVGKRQGDLHPYRDVTGLLQEGERAAASGDI